jgi:hypothetical protein
MKKNTLIEHKEVIVCEKNGSISMSYNVLLTTLEANAMVKPVVITKLALTCTNCGKIDHSMETCHSRKKKVLIMPTAIVKSTELVVGTKTQLVKSRKIFICYPCIYFF